MWETLVLVSQFASVFALVMSSKLLRDDRWVLAMLNSWLISLTQFTFVWVITQTSTPVLTFFCAAIGGSLGCGASHHIYTRYLFKRK